MALSMCHASSTQRACTRILNFYSSFANDPSFHGINIDWENNKATKLTQELKQLLWGFPMDANYENAKGWAEN